MGLPEMEVTPVYFFKGLALGQCRLPEGGQCHQCGIEEEGTEGGGRANVGHLEAQLSWMGFMVLVLNEPSRG